MSFNTIVIGSKTFNSVGYGSYMLSTIALGDPQDGIKIAPGKKSGANSPTSASVTRYLEQNFTVGTVTTKKKASITVQLSVPDGFTSTQIDSLLDELSTFITPATATRILLGEA